MGFIKKIIKIIIPPDIVFIILGREKYSGVKEINSIIKKYKIPRKYRYNIYHIINCFRNTQYSFLQYVPANDNKNGVCGGIRYSNNSIQFIVDINYYHIAREIFSLRIYNFHCTNIINTNKMYTVFDIGANRGYSALFFAEKEWCKDVYGFEIIPETYNHAKENMNLNEKYKSKIKLFDYGLGAKNEEVKIQHLPHRDGISSMVPEFLQGYAPNAQTIAACVQIRKASEVLRQIILENDIDDIIIKIDVEGAEYQIFDDLTTFYPELFSKVKIIIGDTHLGFDMFYNKLKPFGYEAIWTEPHNNGTCPFEIIKRQ